MVALSKIVAQSSATRGREPMAHCFGAAARTAGAAGSAASGPLAAAPARERAEVLRANPLTPVRAPEPVRELHSLIANGVRARGVRPALSPGAGAARDPLDTGEF